MMYRLFPYCLLLLCLPLLSACNKWEDKPAEDLDLPNKYCNNPIAINYNVGFPGIEDNTVCIFPSDPYAGQYTFQDSVYSEDEVAMPGATINFQVNAVSQSGLAIRNFCGNGNELLFTADRYFRAASDSIIGQGTQLMCRSADTLSGTLEYRAYDSSLYIDFKVVSDTGTSTHKGRAYKK